MTTNEKQYLKGKSEKIHMKQRNILNGYGWTYCGLSCYVRRTGTWKRVTCKNCLRIGKSCQKQKGEVL